MNKRKKRENKTRRHSPRISQLPNTIYFLFPHKMLDFWTRGEQGQSLISYLEILLYNDVPCSVTSLMMLSRARHGVASGKNNNNCTWPFLQLCDGNFVSKLCSIFKGTFFRKFDVYGFHFRWENVGKRALWQCAPSIESEGKCFSYIELHTQIH